MSAIIIDDFRYVFVILRRKNPECIIEHDFRILDKLVKRIDAMNKMMEPIFEGSSSNQKERCLTCVAREWRDELDNVAKEQVMQQLERINVFSKQSSEMNDLLIELFVDRKENVVQYDKDKLAVVQNVLKKMNPDLDQAIDGFFEGQLCDHMIAIDYFGESLANPNRFYAQRCSNMDQMRANACPNSTTDYLMGGSISNHARGLRGIFRLPVNAIDEKIKELRTEIVNLDEMTALTEREWSNLLYETQTHTVATSMTNFVDLCSVVF